MLRFVWKLVLFGSCVGVGHWLVSQVPGAKYVPPRYAELEAALAQGCDIVYSGDSTLCHTGLGDSDPRFTPQILDDLLPDRTVFNYSHGGYMPTVYRALAASILRNEHRPEAMVFTLNLRSFSPVWDMRPAYQFKRDIAILEWIDTPVHFLLRPYLIFGDFESPVSEQEYLTHPVFDGSTPAGIMADYDNPSYDTFTEENLRNRIIAQYMLDIPRDHRKIADLVECVRLLETNGIRAFVYATPIDWQTGQEAVGDRFRAQIEKNAAMVGQAVRGAGGAYLDCSLMLESDVFAWEVDVYPNEHLNGQGRVALAQRLRDWIVAEFEAPKESAP